MSLYDVDDLLDHVDEWRAEFWIQGRQKLRALGLTFPEPEEPAKPPAKRAHRTG